MQQRAFRLLEEEIRRRYFDPEYIKRMEYIQSADVFPDVRPT